MKTRISVFETPSDESHRMWTILLLVIVAALALFATGVACRLIDPDHDWPQAQDASIAPSSGQPSG